MLKHGTVIIAVMSCLSGSVAIASDAPDLPPGVLEIEGDAEWGAHLSGECVACHRQEDAAGSIPRIAGLDAEHFVIAMHAYKQNLRIHPIMQMVAGSLSAEEIAALAAYFNALE